LLKTVVKMMMMMNMKTEEEEDRYCDELSRDA
jgi:hypothetical protein